jgi:hypothetical protein
MVVQEHHLVFLVLLSPMLEVAVAVDILLITHQVLEVLEVGELAFLETELQELLT